MRMRKIVEGMSPSLQASTEYRIGGTDEDLWTSVVIPLHGWLKKKNKTTGIDFFDTFQRWLPLRSEGALKLFCFLRGPHVPGVSRLQEVYSKILFCVRIRQTSISYFPVSTGNGISRKLPSVNRAPSSRRRMRNFGFQCLTREIIIRKEPDGVFQTSHLQGLTPTISIGVAAAVSFPSWKEGKS